MRKIFLLAFTLLMTNQLIAQTELKTKSISVFKNGKSFVVKEGKVPTTDNVYTLTKIPDALFGTLWFVAETNIMQVTSKLEVVDEPVERKASSFTDLLYANKGKQITLTTQDDKTYVGTVEDFDLPEEVNSFLQLKEAELSEKYGSMYSSDFRLFPTVSPVLLLKMNSKWISIEPSSIKTIEFSEKPEKITKSKVRVRKPLVKVKFAKGGEQELNLMYLQNGISWIPSYLLELTSDTEARLRLQAEVVNDVEEIVNTDINFVVGVPNFKFANGTATLTSFVEKLRMQVSNGYDSRFSNAIASQVMADYEVADEKMAIITQDNDNAETSEDFYFYNIKNVNLEKGGRAHYPLYSVPVKIKHLYECNLPTSQNENAYRNYSDDGNYSFNTKYSNVFHSIELKNDTKNPFTTGSVMIIDAKTQKPLAQDLVKYTGVGQTSFIQLTQSPDIRVEEQEKIINTQLQAKKKNGYNYSLLTMQSEVVVVNSKKQDIELSIRKIIAGKSKSATIKYDSKQIPNASSINPIDNLKFDLNVKAGETLRFTYTYEMYVQN